MTAVSREWITSLKIRSETDLSAPGGKSEYLKKAVSFIANINSPIDRAVYISTIAQECDVNRANVDIAVNQIIAKRNKTRERIIAVRYLTAR
ncbi:MAG: hypothetical protein ACLS48_12550 [[Eubacterium] siraeum]